MQKNILKKGAITIPTLAGVLGMIAMIAAPVIYVNDIQASADKKIAEVNTKTEVNATKIENVDDRLDRMEDKIDLLLQKQGVNPKLYESSN